MDAFNLANLIMVCVINIVGSAIPSIMIPFLAKMKNDFHDKRTLNTYVSTILGSGFLLMLLTFAVGFVLVQVFQLKDSNPFYYMTYLMLVIMGFGQFFRMITWVQTSYLQMDSKFISVKLVGALSVLASYLYLLFKPDISIYEVAISISFSFVLETIGLIMANRNRKYRFHLTINFKDKEYRRLIRLTIPAVLSSTIYQFSILIPNFAGAISAKVISPP
ncbi:teichoic acid/polysaccharide export protein [Listeria floridensis FSL S10-1187]|uniref:Teichoic acid/polysaccharide export protein n=2 Tax=Listeria floridensis TaxID=1494962 RepID=A0ABP3AX37_9LIST|nr:teichoic acid/polysaccharide export protein [Listeria floridensis FSL S10-1187]